MVSPSDDQGYENDDFLAELNKRMAAAMEAYNRQPDPEMGGLSPDQVFRLIHADWGAPGSPIQFNEELPLDLLNGSQYFRNSRTLLLAVHKAGGVKATATGNLSRSTVSDLMDTIGDQEAREMARHVNKIINETDYYPIHLARVFCELAGLLKRSKGKFAVPKKQNDLLKEEQSGRLYRTLFVAFFRKFNLAYLAHWAPEVPSIQSCAAFTLCRLGIAAREWRVPADLYPDLFLPAVRAEVEGALSGRAYWKAENVADRMIIRPLIEWNLLQARMEKKKHGQEPVAVRTSPLYDAFLRFRL
jgi:hypothetical protein